MPRKARIDAPGALHHIISRGIAREKVFDDNTDRNFFIDRLGLIVGDTGTQCFAWALIPNHFHLLLKTGDMPIATVMKRLLTGYAMNYNRRHKRYGHLFQNRYKSILCQKAKGIDVDTLAHKAAQIVGIELWQIWVPGKQPEVVQARSLLCYWATSELGINQAWLSKRLKLSQPAISLSVARGRALALENNYGLGDL